MTAKLEALVLALGEPKLIALLKVGAKVKAATLTDAERRLLKVTR